MSTPTLPSDQPDPLSPVDPARPWIDDPRDAPSAMKWLPSLFDPLGETPRLHFTRAWTALFFARLFVFLGPVLLVALLGAAGANDPSGAAPPAWTFPAFVVITALMSTVLHVRRFNNARRSPLWAVLVMVPVMVGGAGFIMGGFQGIEAYNQAVAERDGKVVAIEDLLGTDDSAGDETDAEGDEEREDRGRGEWEEPLDVTEVSAREHAFGTALSTAQAFWAVPALFVMLWSLLWVGRLPNGGGTIRERLAGMESGGLAARY